VVTSINLKNQGVASFLLLFLDQLGFLVDFIDDFLTIRLKSGEGMNESLNEVNNCE
jgi:hypothetical protein